jgi:hypothetical protein
MPYCKYCGYKASTIQSLTANSCMRHPLGSLKGKHALYEGSEKSHYQCKHCGYTASSISALTANRCMNHPLGAHKGYHEPAL